MSRTEKSVKEDFAKDVTMHTIEVLHDDGVYRHIRFGKPGMVVDSFHRVGLAEIHLSLYLVLPCDPVGDSAIR